MDILKDFAFGIYAGGEAGTDTGMTSGPANDPQRIIEALDKLQGLAESFLIRCYAAYLGAKTIARECPSETVSFLTPTRKLDLVLCFQADEDDMQGWKKFITSQIERYGGHIRYLQITEEANVNLPCLDGHYLNSRKALVEGIVHAKKAVRESGYPIEVGFNATPDFNPSRTFWKEIRNLATPDFYESLDYVGLDFFPGVFRPLPSHDPLEVEKLISSVIQAFKNDMADAGIASETPLHISENGFATAGDKSEDDQVTMLSMIISTLLNLRLQFNIHTYELFSLRDANSAVDDIFHRLGIMRDDYAPKRAFFAFADFIHRHSNSIQRRP